MTSIGMKKHSHSNYSPPKSIGESGRFKDRLRLFLSVVLLLLSAAKCYSAEIILIRNSDSSSAEQHQLELATSFYGLDLKVVRADKNHTHLGLGKFEQQEILAVVVEADALSKVDEKLLLRALIRPNAENIPLLIFGVTQETNANLLSEWAGIGPIIVKTIDSPAQLRYVVGHETSITKQLTGVEFPITGHKAFYFDVERDNAVSHLVAVRDNKHVAPVFIEANNDNQKIFLLCKTYELDNADSSPISLNTESAFAKIASVMMFTKYCAGDQGWHATGHYANLTIDDPWLREPYGNLNYQKLLKEMEEHNFHTTIAFIPWNFDRNEPEVVSIFRKFPNRFSICIHGDNHDHKEFTDYTSKPFEGQVTALKQSLARMESFRTQTEIPYERVMVFPHSIAPEQTLEALKGNGYVATINSQNIPMGSSEPSDPLFALRPTTLFFGGLPSILRYPAVPTSDSFLAINNFLDNPIFFYAHENFFSKGIDAFDGLADQVNRIEPDTKWRSVGDIAKQLYLIKRRGDSSFDVLAFSSDIVLANTSVHDAVFYVRKQESGIPAVSSVTVDEAHVPLRVIGGYVEAKVDVPPGQTRRMLIQYQNSNDLQGVSIAKDSVRVYLLRFLSDFRDIGLSRLAAGRMVTVFYNKHRFTPRSVVLFVCGFVAFLVFLLWFLLVVRRRLAEASPIASLRRFDPSREPATHSNRNELGITPSKGGPRL